MPASAPPSGARGFLPLLLQVCVWLGAFAALMLALAATVSVLYREGAASPLVKLVYLSPLVLGAAVAVGRRRGTGDAYSLAFCATAGVPACAALRLGGPAASTAKFYLASWITWVLLSAAGYVAGLALRRVPAFFAGVARMLAAFR
jgi:hypothetical protein